MGWVTHASNLATFVAGLARIGAQSAPLRRWYLANRLRQLSVRAEYALRTDGVSAPPRSVSLRATYLCNARCRMCHYANSVDPDNGQPITRRADIIDLDVAIRLVDALAPSHTMLSITGGEPLVWGEELFELLDYCRRRCVATSVTTNGTLLGRYLDDLLRAPPDILCVSLLGPAPTHDRIVGLPAYERIQGALLALQAHRDGDRWRAPAVITNTVMLPDNSDVFAEVVPLSQTLGACGASFQPLWFATADMHQTCDDSRPPTDPAVAGASGNLTPQATAPVALWRGMQRARELSARLAHPVFFYPRLSQRDTRAYYDRPDQPLGRSRALCAHLLSNVLPDGAVSPCPGHVVGNLHEEGFLQIWNGPRMRAFRTRVRRAGMFPICSRCCSLWRNE